MNPPERRIPVILPLVLLGIFVTVTIIQLVAGCKITDLKLDVKEVRVPVTSDVLTNP